MKASMTTPVLKSVKREEREKDGFSTFKEWVETPNHIYIGHNIKKYQNILLVSCAKVLIIAMKVVNLRKRTINTSVLPLSFQELR